MKKILLLLFFCCFVHVPQARADLVCFCGTAGSFETWVTTGWVPFITAMATFDENIQSLLKGASTASAYGGASGAAMQQQAAKDQAKAETMTKYQADNVNRQSELAMVLLEKTIRQDTPMHKMRLGKIDTEDGASVDGMNAISAAKTRRELRDRMRERAKLDGRNGRGGEGIQKTHALRQKLADLYVTKVAEEAAKQAKEDSENVQDPKYNVQQLVPGVRTYKDENGNVVKTTGLTYPNKDQAVALSEIIAMALTSDPWPDPENLSFASEEKAKEYKAALIMQDIIKDPALDAIMDWISMYIGVTDAQPIWDLIKFSGGANSVNPKEAYPCDANNQLSMADIYRAWVEHFLSPTISEQINSDNATSIIQEALSRMYLMMQDSERALSNAVTILALQQSGAQEKIENMRHAFMNAARGANAQ